MRNKSEKTHRFVILGVGIYLLLWEIIKQIILILDGYNWHQFPLQPCSVGMYVLILWGVLKPSKVRDYIGAFIITFVFFFGMTVVVVPAFVFAEYQQVLLLWQSPQHHILLAIAGIYMVMSKSVPLIRENLLRGIIAYLVIFVAFLIVNAWVNPIFPDSVYINAFYSGPYRIFEIPILSSLVNITNYTLYLPIMLVSNIIGGFLAFAVLIECRYLYEFKKTRGRKTKEKPENKETK